MPRPIRVLHVDDDPGFADLTADFLERTNEQIEVVTETSPTDALDSLGSRDVDCVVSDHDMAEMDGIELLEAVRERDGELPFILFTGKGSEEVASKAVSTGVTDYLQKEHGTDHYTLLANRIENAVDRFRSRRAAQTRKRRLETLVSNLPGMVYRCRNAPDWPMEEVGGECEQLTGYSADALESGEVRWGEAVVHPDDRGHLREEVQEALDRGDPFECTYRIRTADGERKWVWERGRGVDESTAGAAALEGFITDITESKRRERRFEAIFDNTYQFIGLLDPDGTVLEANDAALTFADVTREDVVGRPLPETAWFQGNDRARDVAREAVETARRGELFREELRLEGARRDALLDFSVRPVTDEDGEVTLLVPEARDITDLRERTRRLHRNERRFEAIFDDPNLLVGLLDPDGTVLDVNETAIEYVDADRADVIGAPFAETPWWADDQRGDVERWIADAADGEYVEYEAAHRTEDGISAMVEGSFRPVADDAGAVTTIIVSAHDVTERERRKRELHRRNERFDEFASFVSHDLQSPISAVYGRLELAMETGEMEHVERAADALERVDDLRTDLVNMLRTGNVVSETEPVDLAATMEAVWLATDPPAAASFAVESDPSIDADPMAIQRLLENLVRNSVEHGSDDVDVRVGRIGDGLYYEDDGPGIDPEHRDRVFTPGFSTKRGEEGIGMGLASVRQIALAHGWSIGVGDAESLDGVRFEFRAG